MADVPPPTEVTPDPTALPSLFTCPTCVSDPIDCSSGPRQYAFKCGDVYPTTDSIYGPVMAIFNAVGGGGSIPSMGTIQSPTMSDRVHSDERNHRPCILLRNTSQRASVDIVCLMTTYQREPLDTMPEIFRHFSLPVHPNPIVVDPFKDHVHSHPQWGHPHQWIFTYRYPSSRVCKNRGPWLGGYAFDDSALEHIIVRCIASFLSWKNMCKADPTWAVEQQVEVIDHERKNAEKSFEQARAGSVSPMGSTSSIHGRRTAPYSSARSRASRQIATIPEDGTTTVSDIEHEKDQPIATSGPSRPGNIPGGAYRSKDLSSIHSHGRSRTSLTSMEHAFSNVRVNTPDQADTQSVRSSMRFKPRKGSKPVGGLLSQLKDRVRPSRKSSKE